jgi:hypothetical protein
VPAGDSVGLGVDDPGDRGGRGVPGDLGGLGEGDSGEYLLGLVKARTAVEGLRQLRGEALLGFLMNSEWFARENDLIGGWCIVPMDMPPSSGVVTIADFIDERAARHIAWLHNRFLSERRVGWGGLPLEPLVSEEEK